MNVDITDILYSVIILLSIAFAILAIIFLGWYLLWLLLISGTIGGTAYSGYQIFELWKKAHKTIRWK